MLVIRHAAMSEPPLNHIRQCFSSSMFVLVAAWCTRLGYFAAFPD